MRTRFFNLAFALASRMAERPARLVSLVARVFVHLDRTRFRKMSFAATREKLKQLGRLVVAYARGEYRRIPVKSIITITAVLLYFLNPLDLVPDVVPALGLADDFAVLSWVYQSISSEMSAFLEWERSATSA